MERAIGNEAPVCQIVVKEHGIKMFTEQLLKVHSGSRIYHKRSLVDDTLKIKAIHSQYTARSRDPHFTSRSNRNVKQALLKRDL